MNEYNIDCESDDKNNSNKYRMKFRVWIEKDGKPVIGRGGAEILKALKKYSSLSKASKELGMSYRFVWMYINRIEKVTGLKIVDRMRGGKEGGKTVLTEEGLALLEMYERAESELKATLNKINKTIDETILHNNKINQIK